MESNNKINWMSQKSIQYLDPETTNLLNIFLESGVIEDDNYGNTYSSPRITFQIKDNRIQNNFKIQIELYFLEIVNFIETNNRKILSDIKKAYTNNENISITKNYHKNKKELQISFIMKGSTPIVSLSIHDPLSSLSKKDFLYIPHHIYKTIYLYVKQVMDNYSLISSNMLNICIQEKIIDSLRNLENTIKGYRPVINQYQENSLENANENIEYDVTKESMKELYDINNDLSNYLGDLSNIEIPDLKNSPFENISQNQGSNKKDIHKSSRSFISNFLNNDIIRMNDWVSAFTNANEKSSENMFCPFNVVLNNCLINDDISNLSDDIFNNKYVLKAQTILNIMFRKNIKYFIETGKFMSSFQVYKFPFKISKIKYENLYRICEELIAVFLIYTKFVSNYNNYIKNNPNSISDDSGSGVAINDIKLTQNFLRSYLMSFILSLDINDKEEFKSDIISIMKEFDKSDFLKNIDKFYTENTMGGKLDYSITIMEPTIDSIIGTIFSNNVPVFDNSLFDKVCMDNDIYIDGHINDVLDVKKYTMMCVKTTRNNDNKYKLFRECCEKYLDNEQLKVMDSKCDNYSDITKYLESW